jgi:hypothetical protein
MLATVSDLIIAINVDDNNNCHVDDNDETFLMLMFTATGMKIIL